MTKPAKMENSQKKNNHRLALDPFHRKGSHVTLALLASYLVLMTPNTVAEQNLNPLDAKSTPVEFALGALEEACSPYTSTAHHSLQATDLALYCVSTGESIVLQAAQNPSEKQFAQQAIAHWIEKLQPTLAQY